MIVNRNSVTPERPRIVICGVGQYGSSVARTALEVGYEIVGAYNRAGPKIGKDLGEVIGLGRRLGLIIEDIATADLRKVKAHCGVSTQTNDLRRDMLSYKRLMEAGINVLTLAMEGYYPFRSDPEAAWEIDACARKHGVTFSGSGIHDQSRIWSGITAAGQCTRLDSIYQESLTNAAGQGLPEQMPRDYAIGATVEDYMSRGFDKARLWPVYTVTLAHIFEVLGYTVIEQKTRIEPVVWDEPLDCEWMKTVIPAGRVLGTRTIGEVRTKEGPVGTVKTEGRVCAKHEVDYTLWKIEGKPRCEVLTKRPDGLDMNTTCLINRIKDVIAGPPGIVPISQFGPLQGPELGWRLNR
jgi:4-hydroxy-tetrahydrodipicolinate reductase